jgi:C-3',4' desaturase CrtD
MKKVVVIGAGISGLAAAALLAKKGFSVEVIEQNWMVGGCAATYWRKGHRFESGATTLVGLSENRPIHWLLNELEINALHSIKLDLPMQVHGLSTNPISRFEGLEEWIAEAENKFGKLNQRKFWTKCFNTAQFVWENALELHHFPPQSFTDLVKLLPLFNFNRLKHLPSAFQSVADWMRSCDLHTNKRFVRFIDEQLMITAQNTASDVNLLFGATALCYTNEPNHYLTGGMQQLANTLANKIIEYQGQIHLREATTRIEKKSNGYQVRTSKNTYLADFVVSSVPLNNLEYLVDDSVIVQKIKKKSIPITELSGAFTMGIAFHPHRQYQCIHHQLHLNQPMNQTGARSIFFSIHPEEDKRSDVPNTMVGAVSMHVFNPSKNIITDKNEVMNLVIDILVQNDLIKRENIIYSHASTPGSWEDWTLRKSGIVGGYPQKIGTKPWQMLGCQIDGHGFLGVGDSFYPGQGIPGVILGAKAAVETIVKKG